jgi:hypothetical protein
MDCCPLSHGQRWPSGSGQFRTSGSRVHCGPSPLTITSATTEYKQQMPATILASMCPGRVYSHGFRLVSHRKYGHAGRCGWPTRRSRSRAGEPPCGRECTASDGTDACTLLATAAIHVTSLTPLPCCLLAFCRGFVASIYGRGNADATTRLSGHKRHHLTRLPVVAPSCLLACLLQQLCCTV